LAKNGYKLVQSGQPESSRDLLITWNLYGGYESMAAAWERRGGTVLVCENGYIGKDKNGQQYYAISAHGHNGSGWFPPCSGRFAKLGIELQPWRTAGDFVLVCGQRGIGSKTMASPAGWHDKAAKRIQQLCEKQVRIRPHPGKDPPKTPVEDDLQGAWACAIWSSSSGIKALVNGIPVAFDAPFWIAEDCAVKIDGIAHPIVDDGKRLLAMEKVASAQWSIAEIEAGLPFALFRERLN
jgi:hypothetical protein